MNARPARPDVDDDQVERTTRTSSRIGGASAVSTNRITAATLQPERGVTIRAKLYVAILLTVHRSGDHDRRGAARDGAARRRFDEVQDRADRQALALDLKFGVTDFNGWQTAYGYDDGASRPRFERSVARFEADFAEAAELTDPRERAAAEGDRTEFDQFMALDDVAYAALQRGDDRA